MFGKITLVGQDDKLYTITAFGMEKNSIFCTTDKECKEKHIIATYQDITRTEEVFNKILKSMEDYIVLPEK